MTRIRDALIRQIDSPVRWVASVQRLAREGVDSGARDRAGQRPGGARPPDRPVDQGRGPCVEPAPLLSPRCSPRLCDARARDPPTATRRSPRPSAAASAGSGVAARHLESNRAYEHNAEVEFESASVIKIAVLTEAIAAVREGRVDLSERWDLTLENKADGSGDSSPARSGPQPDVERPGDPDDRPLRQHRDQRVDREAVRRCHQRADAVAGLRAHPPASARSRSSRCATTVPPPGRACGSASITPHDVAEWMTRVARGSSSTPSPRRGSSTTSTRTRAACASLAASRRTSSGRARPAPCRASATTPASCGTEGPLRARHLHRRQPGGRLGAGSSGGPRDLEPRPGDRRRVEPGPAGHRRETRMHRSRDRSSRA